MNDLKEKVIRGSFAKILSQAINIIVKLGSLIVLARILDPKDFGLVTMVTAVTGVFYILKDAGFSMATIQRDYVSHEQMSNLFWINIMIGVIIALLLIALAPMIAKFYQEPRLYWVTIALGVDFIFTGATAQHSALLQRQMRFDVIAVIENVSLFSGIIVAIIMALKGFGFWALVSQNIVAPVISAFCTWYSAKWLPSKPRRDADIASMLRFGGTITLNGFVIYVSYNIEKILLGRFWGADAVGVYGKAYQLIRFPMDALFSAIGGVMFSALSRIQDDPQRLKRYFLKGYSLILALCIPVVFSCGIFAEEMVLVMLGQKWRQAIPIFQYLSPLVFVLTLINPFFYLLLALGLAKRSLIISFVISPIVIIAYIVGLQNGPSGVAITYSLFMLLWLPAHIAWCVYNTGISCYEIFNTIYYPLLASIIAAVIILVLQTQLGKLHSPFFQLVWECAVMFTIYLCVLLELMRQKKFYMNIIFGLKKQAI